MTLKHIQFALNLSSLIVSSSLLSRRRADITPLTAVSAVEQLQVMASKWQYKEAAAQLEAANQLCNHFEAYRDIPKMTELREKFKNIKQILKSHVFSDFSRVFVWIPNSSSNLQQIESLDLSHNNLNGQIPQNITELFRLAVFSVAYNNLSGKTPEGIAQFGTFEESSYQGNPLLCGLPLLKSCGSPPLAPKAATGNDEDINFIDMDIFYISFTVSYMVVVLAIAIVLFVNPYWRQTWFCLVETWMTSSYYFIIDHLPKGFCH